MTFDDRVRAAAADVADRVQTPPPDIARIVARGRRKIRLRVVGCALAVAAIVATVGIAVGVDRDIASDPIDHPDRVEPLTGPAWVAEDGIHVGNQTIDVRGTVTSLGLVRDGVVYGLDDGSVRFQAPGEEAHVIGQDSRHGPVGEVLGAVAAWFEGDRLVVHDTATERTLASVPTSFSPRGLVFPDEHPILSVSANRVRFEAGGAVWDVDLNRDLPRLSRVSLASDTLIDSAAAVDVLVDKPVRDQATGALSLARLRVGADGELLSMYGPVFQEGSLSPDGRYLATVSGYDRGNRLVILDVSTGTPVRLSMPDLRVLPMPSPWGWSYDDTLVVAMTPEYTRRMETIMVACAVSDHRCQTVDEPASMPPN